jgi:hypothetical protein
MTLTFLLTYSTNVGGCVTLDCENKLGHSHIIAQEGIHETIDASGEPPVGDL